MLEIMSTAEVLVRGLLKGMSDKDIEIQRYVLPDPNRCPSSVLVLSHLESFPAVRFILLFLQREKKLTHIFNTARN